MRRPARRCTGSPGCRGAGADHADALAGEVDALVRPAAGVVPLALEVVESGNSGIAWRRQAADGADEEPGRRRVSRRSVTIPAVRAVVVEPRRRDAGLELDVAPQVETVGDVVGVAAGSPAARGSARSTSIPAAELLGEGVAVVMLSTSQRAPGIAVPVPGAADAVARLEDPGGEPELAQACGACTGRRSRRRRLRHHRWTTQATGPDRRRVETYDAPSRSCPFSMLTRI